jgi:hypothetical protein
LISETLRKQMVSFFLISSLNFKVSPPTLCLFSNI